MERTHERLISEGQVGIDLTISTIRNEWTSNIGLVVDTARPIIEIFLDAPSKLPLERQRIDVCLPVMFWADRIGHAHHSHGLTSRAIR